MEKQLNKLNQNIFNWKATVKQADGREALVKQLFKLLVAELPEVQTSILKAYKENDMKTLAERVHKLHGSCCYCILPKLTPLVKKLDAQFQKKNYEELDANIKKLLEEIQRVKNEIEHFDVN